MAEPVGSLYYEIDLDTRRLVEGARTVDRELDKAARSFNVITTAVKLYAAALTLVKAAQTADDVRLLGARLEVAAGSAEKGAEALAELQRIAARTQTELAGNVAVFARLNNSILQMGGTQRDTLRITELLGMAIKVSGASAQEAQSAMTQFAQALGSGKLQGDELRSLLENAPYLMQQLADGIGVPVGALKQLGEEGKLTADVVTNALQKAAGKIAADFAKVPQTVGGAMTQASDAAARLIERLDTVSGTSAAMTGALKGAGTVLDMLAAQFRGSSAEADKLGRANSVQTWAERTTQVLTYVADAADIVVRMFRQGGTAIGGLAAAAVATASGEFRQAGSILAQMKDDVLAIGDAKFAGQVIRDTLAAARTEDRGFTPDAPGSKLKPAAGADGDKSKFDALAYLAKLREETANAYEQIGIIEQEALRKNEALQAAGKITAQQAAEARTLIETAAAQKRREILLNEAEERRLLIEESGKNDAAAEAKAAEERARGRKAAEDAITGGDPVRALLLEQERRSQLLREYAAKDQANAQLYAEALVALETETQRRITEIRQKAAQDQLNAQSQVMTAYGQLFGSLADITKTFKGEQSGAYKAMFAVSKAFAIADAIVKIQQGVAAALSLPYPANIAAAASTASAAAGIVSTIRGTQFGGGRQYGGGTDAGSLYRVNETGRPEMFTAANGAQYMLPTTRGEVTPANEVGGGVKIEVHNYAGVEVQASTRDDGRVVEIAVRRAKAEIAGDIRSNTGEVFGALRSSTNVRGAL